MEILIRICHLVVYVYEDNLNYLSLIGDEPMHSIYTMRMKW